MGIRFGVEEILKAIRKHIGAPFDTFFLILVISTAVVLMLQWMGLEFDTVLVLNTTILILLLVAFREILTRRMLFWAFTFGLCFAVLRQWKAIKNSVLAIFNVG